MIDAMLVNLADLYEMVPARDNSGGEVDTPTLVTAGIPCSVQPMNAGERQWWAMQARIAVDHNVFFSGDVGVQVSGTTPTKEYRLTWTDPPTGSIFLRLEAYKEATLGRFLVYQAVCKEVA